MRILRFSLRWGVPSLLSVVAFGAGYLTFYPSLGGKLTDGSAPGFADVAEQIQDARLLETASPVERISWLMEICAQPRGMKRDHTLFEAIQSLRPGDFAAAIADLPQLSKWLTSLDAELRVDVIQASIERWLEVDEARRLRWLPVAQKIVESGALDLPQIGEKDFAALYLALARQKQGWMFENAQQFGPKMGRSAAVQAAIQAAVEAGLPQAGRWLATLKGTREYEATRLTYINALAKMDPEHALTFTQAEMPANSQLAQRIIVDCAVLRPELATNLLDQLKKAEREKIMMPLGEAIAANPACDPFQWLEDQVKGHPEIYDPTRSYMLTGLAKRDPARTMEWIKRFPEEKRDELAPKVLAIWMEDNPKAVLAWLNEHPDTNALKRFSFFNQLAFEEPAALTQWAAKLPPSDLQNRAQYDLAVHAVVRGNFAEAAKLFPANSTGQEFNDKANEFGWRLAKADPQEAMRWLGTLPPGGVQQEAMAGVMGQWADRSPEAAAKSVENLPPGPLRDAGAGALARNFARRDFEGANTWLAEIQDEQIRTTTAANIFRLAVWNNPERTREWLRTLPGITETVRNRLLRTR